MRGRVRSGQGKGRQLALFATTEQIITELQTQRGNISATARVFGVNRRKLKLTIDSSPDLVAVVEEQREELLDEAETVIHDAVRARDVEAAKFALRTIGRDRGYTTSTEVRGNPQHPISFDREIVFRGVAPADDQSGA